MAESNSPRFRAGMIHGAYQAAMPARVRPGYHPDAAGSWMYRRGFARGFLAARKAGGSHDASVAAAGPVRPAGHRRGGSAVHGPARPGGGAGYPAVLQLPVDVGPGDPGLRPADRDRQLHLARRTARSRG